MGGRGDREITVLLPITPKQPHKHDYVPVDVLWLNLWGAMSSFYGKKRAKPPTPCWVVLACKCGAVKLVPAKLKDKKKVLEYYLGLK